MKKLIKRSFAVLALLLLLLLAAMVAIPYFFKDDLLRVVKEQANASMHARLDFADVELSFFRQFPLLTLSIEDFSVKGMDEFEGVELAGGERLDLSFRIMELFGSDRVPTIRALHLEKPRIRVVVLQDGTANYDIAKTSADDAPAETAAEEDYDLLALKKYSIKDGQIVYDDKQMDFYLSMHNLNHEGNGHFTANTYELDTRSDVQALTLAYGGVRYLKEVQTKLVAGLFMDLGKMRFELRENDLLLNALPLKFDGYLALPDDAIEMDLSFSSPGSSFKELFSIMPDAYTPAYADAQVNGSFVLKGSVKGRMTDEAYPAMNIHLKIKDGSVQYPDLPMGLRDIQAQLAVQSPQGDLDGMQLNIPIAHFKLGENPFSFKLLLKTPMSDPDVDMRVKGVLDLGDLAKAYPLQDVSRLAGRLNADVQARVRMSQLEREAYDEVNMQGQMQLADFQYEAKGQPPVKAKKLNLKFSPQYVALEEALLQLGRSDLQASGRVDNLPALFSSSKTLRGSMRLHSNALYVDEWMAAEETTANTVNPQAVEVNEDHTEIPAFDFDIMATCGKIVYDAYTLENFVCKGQGSLDELKVEKLAFDMEESDFDFTGAFRQIDEYLFKEGVLGGEVALRAHYLNLNPFMETDEESASTSSPEENYEPIEVPSNLHLIMLADVDKLLYTNIELKNLQARLVIEDGQVILEKCTTNTLGGAVALSGLYDSSVQGDPVFNFKYDLSGMDFQKAYTTFNTFETMAPMAKYVYGKFNSSLIMEGRLGSDLMPRYDAISADGFLETIQGKIKGMPALAAIDQQLGVPLLSGMELKDTRNWFEIRNGRVEVKPFDYEWEGIAMNISGNHAFTGEMDYYIKADVPREKLGSFANAAIDKGLNALQKQAGALGLSLEQAETVKLGITLKGTWDKPKIGIKLLGTDGQQTVQDAAKEELQNAVAKEKEKVQQQAEEKLDEAKAQAREELDKAAAKAEEAAKEQIQKGVTEAEKKAGEVIGEQAGELGKKAEEALGQQGQKAKEEIEQQLENFNPFKKKKDKKKKKSGN